MKNTNRNNQTFRLLTRHMALLPKREGRKVKIPPTSLCQEEGPWLQGFFSNRLDGSFNSLYTA